MKMQKKKKSNYVMWPVPSSQFLKMARGPKSLAIPGLIDTMIISIWWLKMYPRFEVLTSLAMAQQSVIKGTTIKFIQENLIYQREAYINLTFFLCHLNKQHELVVAQLRNIAGVMNKFNMSHSIKNMTC